MHSGWATSQDRAASRSWNAWPCRVMAALMVAIMQPGLRPREVERRGEDEVSLGGDAVGLVPDVPAETEDVVDDHDPGPRTCTSRYGEAALEVGVAAGKAHAGHAAEYGRRLPCAAARTYAWPNFGWRAPSRPDRQTPHQRPAP